jgi:site-specific DNA-adenine methylase
MINPPLRYPCGRSRAVETIAKLLPDFDEFREPFLRGSSVFVETRTIKTSFPPNFSNKTTSVAEEYHIENNLITSLKK